MDHVLTHIMDLHCDHKSAAGAVNQGWLTFEEVTSVFGDDEPGPFISHHVEMGECLLVFPSLPGITYKLVECNSNGSVCSDRLVPGTGVVMSVPLYASDVVNQVSLYGPDGAMLFSGRYRAA